MRARNIASPLKSEIFVPYLQEPPFINQVRIDDYSNGIDIMDANGNLNFQELNTIVNAFTSKGIVVQLDGSNPQTGIFSGQSLVAQDNF